MHDDSDGQSILRERKVTWDDPQLGRKLAERQGLSGIDYLRAIRAGELPAPPMALLMGMTMTVIEPGRVVFTAEPSEYHYNPLGVVHGGLAATLLDSAMGCAVQTLASAGSSYTTLELKVNLLRAMRAGMGVVSGEGTVLHFGRQTALAEARLIGADGKLYAHATSTCLIMRPENDVSRPS